MTIFGNRDFEPPDGPGEDTGVVADVDASPTAEVCSPLFPADIRRVILRINGDEDIVVGRAEGRDPAVEIAREMVRQIESASARGEWPQIDERFVRPGAIVSVDVQRGE